MERRARFNSEKGVTLVELLAVLTLLGIISVIVYSVGFQGFTSEEKASNTLTLNQEANVFISELRSQYYKDKNDTEICAKFKDGIEIEAESKFTNGEKELTYVNGCIIDIDKNKPLSLEIIFSNADDQKLKLVTTWNHQQPHIALDIAEGGDDDDDSPPGEGGDDGDSPPPKIELDFLPCLDNPEYNNKDIKWDGTTLESNCSQHSGENSDKYGTYKNLVIVNELKLVNNELITIHAKDLTFQDEVELGNNAELTLEGTTSFKNELKLENGAKVDISQDATFQDQVVLKNGAELTISGEGFFGNEINLENNAKVDISKDATFKDAVELENNEEMFLNKNAAFYGEVKLGNNARMKILGDATFGDSVDRKSTRLNSSHV